MLLMRWCESVCRNQIVAINLSQSDSQSQSVCRNQSVAIMISLSQSVSRNQSVAISQSQSLSRNHDHFVAISQSQSLCCSLPPLAPALQASTSRIQRRFCRRFCRHMPCRRFCRLMRKNRLATEGNSCRLTSVSMTISTCATKRPCHEASLTICSRSWSAGDSVQCIQRNKERNKHSSSAHLP